MAEKQSLKSVHARTCIFAPSQIKKKDDADSNTQRADNRDSHQETAIIRFVSVLHYLSMLIHFKQPLLTLVHNSCSRLELVFKNRIFKFLVYSEFVDVVGPLIAHRGAWISKNRVSDFGWNKVWAYRFIIYLHLPCSPFTSSHAAKNNWVGQRRAHPIFSDRISGLSFWHRNYKAIMPSFGTLSGKHPFGLFNHGL